MALLAAALIAGIVIGGGAAGTGTTIKPFNATFSSSVAGGATNADIQLTITNLSSNQALGSANVTAATNVAGAAFTITGESGADVDVTQTYPASLLMLRNLGIPAGGSRTVHISVNTPCAGGAYTWGITAKQSNDYKGPPGNAFTLQFNGSSLTTTISGSCKLKFVTQPANANINTVVTNAAYMAVTGDPTGPQYVSVEAVDGGDNPVSASGTVTLKVASLDSGTFTGSGISASFDSQGIATFSGLKSSTEAKNVQLYATASGYADSDPSGPFSVTTGGTSCSGTVCSGSTTLSNGGKIDFTGTGSFDFIAIDDASTVPGSVTAPLGGCEHFIGTGTGFEESDTRNSDGTLDFTYYIKNTALKKAYGPNYGQPDVPFCAGGKVVVGNQPVDCDPLTQAPWHGRHLGSDGKFDGTYRNAVCGADGYWWGILGNKLDPNPPIDPTIDPRVTAWGSTPDGVFRTFNIHVTAGWDWRTN